MRFGGRRRAAAALCLDQCASREAACFDRRGRSIFEPRAGGRARRGFAKSRSCGRLDCRFLFAGANQNARADDGLPIEECAVPISAYRLVRVFQRAAGERTNCAIWARKATASAGRSRCRCSGRQWSSYKCCSCRRREGSGFAKPLATRCSSPLRISSGVSAKQSPSTVAPGPRAVSSNNRAFGSSPKIIKRLASVRLQGGRQR